MNPRPPAGCALTETCSRPLRINPQVERFGVAVLDMHTLHQQDAHPSRAICDFINAHVPQGAHVYLSVDLDALDPAFAPGVSHHEPGGLSTRELLAGIHGIRRDCPLVGADVVEFNPARDVNGVTAMVAAKVAKEIIGKMQLQ